MRFLLLIILTGCSSINNEYLVFNGLEQYRCIVPDFISIDSLLPETIKINSTRAINYWNSIDKLFAIVDLYDKSVLNITSFNDLSSDTLGYTYLKLGTDGCIKESIIYLNMHRLLNNPDHVIESVIRHEIGHALGLDHSIYKDDLMYSYMNIDISHVKSISNNELHIVYKYYGK